MQTKSRTHMRATVRATVLEDESMDMHTASQLHLLDAHPQAHTDIRLTTKDLLTDCVLMGS